MKSLFVLFTALVSILYLLNPTAGFIELIPDNVPIIGNLDEAAAVALLLSALRYFGFDLSRFFGRKSVESEGEKEE